MSSLPSQVVQRSEATARATGAAETEELASIGHVAQALAEQADLRPALVDALKRLTKVTHSGIVGASVVVAGDGRRDGEIRIAEGLSASWRRGAKPDKATRPDITSISAPVVLAGATIGECGLDYFFSPDRDLDRALACATLLAAIVAHAVAAHRRGEQERQRLLDEGGDAQAQGPSLSKLVGTSGPLGQVRTLVAQVAPSNTTVLLRGETGTGKGLIAHAIHLNSPRAKKPFVTVSCAALPRELIESELFGYEKGAFTGADALKKGRLELANGGTLFLDEVGELTPEVQVKLLRVLQAREFDRLGGSQAIPLDVRLLAATNRNLDKAIAAGDFREDLYYRLSVFPIFVPPLRERKADVLLLADHFLEKFAREHGKNIARISTPAIDMMMSYHWPGNVRELGNAIERAVAICDGGVVHSHHLPPTLQTAESTGTASHLSLQEMVEAVEKDALQDALKSARGNRATAARLLRTTRRIFNYKLKNYGINWRRFQD